MFVDITNNIKSNEHLQEAVDLFEKFQFKLKAETLSGKKTYKNETSFLGEINGPRRIEKGIKHGMKSNNIKSTSFHYNLCCIILVHLPLTNLSYFLIYLVRVKY